MDNYAGKRVEIHDWLAEHPGVHVHFTSISASSGSLDGSPDGVCEFIRGAWRAVRIWVRS